jgi:plastocyanin
MGFNRWLRRLIVLGAVAVAAVAAGCGGAEEASKAGTASSGKAAGGESETVAVSMKDNFFEPKDITVERGEAITFNLKNEGQAIHDMHIMSLTAEGKDFMSNVTIPPGETSSFKATFTKTGSLKFQCDYHLPDMVGTITVK